jgi:hypothetical protein
MSKIPHYSIGTNEKVISGAQLAIDQEDDYGSKRHKLRKAKQVPSTGGLEADLTVQQ